MYVRGMRNIKGTKKSCDPLRSAKTKQMKKLKSVLFTKFFFTIQQIVTINRHSQHV